MAFARSEREVHMIHVHRGAGMLVPLLGILAAVLMNVITVKFLGDAYYQEQRWPKLVVLLTAGLWCLIAGLLLKRKRRREATKERDYINSLGSTSEAMKQLAFSGPRDHLMFIPVQYWSLVYLAAAIFYLITTK
jgi:hypothetical protein